MVLQVPEVHLTLCNVSKTTDHENRTEWTDLQSVSKLLSEFKSRFAIKVVHCRRSRLLTWNDDELLSILCPFDILNLVIKHTNSFSIFSFVNTNILKGVLSIITFSSWIVLVLRPDQDGMSRWCWDYQDVICPWARDVELGSLKITV